MYAHAEAEMACGVAFEVEAVRVAPAAWIAIGGPEEALHFLTGRDVYPLDFDITSCSAKEDLHRRIPAYSFLTGCSGQRWILSQQAPLIRVSGQAVDSRVDSVDCGVYARAEEGAHQQASPLFRDLACIC